MIEPYDIAVYFLFLFSSFILSTLPSAYGFALITNEIWFKAKYNRINGMECIRFIGCDRMYLAIIHIYKHCTAQQCKTDDSSLASVILFPLKMMNADTIAIETDLTRT